MEGESPLLPAGKLSSPTIYGSDSRLSMYGKLNMLLDVMCTPVVHITNEHCSKTIPHAYQQGTETNYVLYCMSCIYAGRTNSMKREQIKEMSTHVQQPC